MTEELKNKAKRGKKLEAEKGSEPKIVAEDNAVKEEVKKKYSSQHLIEAIEDVSIEVNNAYFRTPYNRCPNCNKGNNAVMGHFGLDGNNKLGNLKGFQATIGDVIAWSSDTYKGLSIVKGKENGVFELETSPFDTPRKEPAVIERMVVPSALRPIIGEMATYLANKELYNDVELVKIGKREYPNAIKRKL